MYGIEHDRMQQRPADRKITAARSVENDSLDPWSDLSRHDIVYKGVDNVTQNANHFSKQGEFSKHLEFL